MKKVLNNRSVRKKDGLPKREGYRPPTPNRMPPRSSQEARRGVKSERGLHNYLKNRKRAYSRM